MIPWLRLIQEAALARCVWHVLVILSERRQPDDDDPYAVPLDEVGGDTRNRKVER